MRSFLAVVDAGSLSAAARVLGAQQPTLGRHVAELEAQLGAPLFERTGRGLRPTAMALAIADAARRMDEGARRLADAVVRRRDAPGGTVRITTSQIAAAWLLPPALAELQMEAPGIEIELVASNRVANLLRREADIAVRMARPTQASLIARRLGDVAIGAYAHHDYLARAGVPRAPGELGAHRLLGYDSDDTILRGFAALGMPAKQLRFALRTDDHIAYAQMVAQGAGIGFLADYHAAQLPGLRRVLPQLRIPSLPCWLAVHREIRGSRIVRQAFDHLADALPRRLALLAGSSPPPA